ncbi:MULTISPECIES: DUF692 domain-containing protein [unclassified Halomonas]|uniref:MNIO family bufferin maturase n=1 Tax=unclassified Halomonas TaxID=2609666 RepID=UPI001C95E12D|nr:MULTISPECIES: DUF692 domain-containing protein [unclassified Halomonas]MBY5924528.1 DUF692 domain-containing protein [Halomonas sp. DP4Y7-2]MBY6231570.1 DUF692 domain-containing protein [Halomonas sp. DP4Y7-1]
MTTPSTPPAKTSSLTDSVSSAWTPPGSSRATALAAKASAPSAITGLPLPLAAMGIGLKFQHLQELAALESGPDFLELHAENYMNAGGPVQEQLAVLSRRYPLSVHGVGLSLGSAEGIDPEHLKRLTTLVDQLKPALVSEHLAWSRLDGHSYNDLLPVPLNQESLRVMCDNVARTQDSLGRQLLVENPSLYVRLDQTMSETQFLQALVEATGCGLLFDVNNAFISAANLNRDLDSYLQEVPWHAVGEWHLAGHTQDSTSDLYIDDHGSPVADPVWQRYRQVARLRPELPTLVEWDNRVPPLSRWLEEVALARRHHASAQDAPPSQQATPLPASGVLP